MFIVCCWLPWNPVSYVCIFHAVWNWYRMYFHCHHCIGLYKHPALMFLGHSTVSIVRFGCLFGIALGTDFIHVMFWARYCLSCSFALSVVWERKCAGCLLLSFLNAEALYRMLSAPSPTYSWPGRWMILCCKLLPSQKFPNFMVLETHQSHICHLLHSAVTIEYMKGHFEEAEDSHLLVVPTWRDVIAHHLIVQTYWHQLLPLPLTPQAPYQPLPPFPPFPQSTKFFWYLIPIWQKLIVQWLASMFLICQFI